MTKNTYGKKYIIYMVALLAVTVIGAFTGDPVQSMIAAGVGGGFFAATCIKKFKPYTVIPMAVLPPLITYLLTFSVDKTALSLSFIPVGAALYYGIRKGLSRSQTLVRCVGALAVYYFFVYALYVYILFGSVTLETIEKYINLNLDVVRTYMDKIKNMYAEMGVEVEEFFPRVLIDAVIESLRMSWLGYALAFFGVVSYAGSMIAKSATADVVIPELSEDTDSEEATKKRESMKAAVKERFGTDIILNKWDFVFSKAGAIVFILAYLASAAYSPETDGKYFPFALNTICFSMYPAVVFMGIKNIIERLRSPRRMFFLIMLIIGVAVFGASMMLFVIIIGLFATLTRTEK